MGLFDKFRRRPPPPVSVPVPEVKPLTLSLRPAPRYMPLPLVMPDGTPVDGDLARRWLAFQDKTPGNTWPAFVAELRAENARLEREIASVTSELRIYQ